MAKKKVMKQPTEVSEDAAAQNAASIAMKPSTKMEAMAQAVNLIGTMSGEDLNNFMDMVKQMQGGTAADQIPDGTAEKNAAGLAMKPSAAGIIQGTNIGVSEAIADIFGENEALTDEFREKTEVLFEAAVAARLAILTEEIEEAAVEQLNEAIEVLTENFDAYVTYVAEQWMEENQVAIEGALTNEITQAFIADMKSVFEAHNIAIPEDKVDVLEQMADRMDELEGRLNAAMQENIQLKSENVSHLKDTTLDSVAEGLTMTQKEKLRLMTEGIEFKDPESYAAKLEIVKTQHFVGNKKAPTQTNILSEEVVEDDENDVPKKVSPEMKSYMGAISRLAPRK